MKNNENQLEINIKNAFYCQMISFLFLFLILLIFNKVFLNLIIIEDLISHFIAFRTKNMSRLFFGIVTIENSTNRRNAMYNLWIKHILKSGHDFVFCTKNKIESIYKWTPYKNWAPYNETMLDNNLDRENKRITMANYFLTETNADFFVNPTDDVLVDPLRINELATILYQKYNTNIDSVFLGNCQYTGNMMYLQGGTGYIMSRKMAKDFVKLSKRWLLIAKASDDLEITKFLSFLNITPRDGDCPYMCGHSFPDLLSLNFNPNTLQNCPKNFYEPNCQQGVLNIKDVYMIHPYLMNINQSLKVYYNFQVLLHDKNHSYGWYNTFPTTHVCRFD